jgi:hypothetical protein
MATIDSPESAAATAFGTRAGWRATPWADYLAEFLGTFVIITFGCGVVATSLAALPESGRTEAAFLGGGDCLLITFGSCTSPTTSPKPTSPSRTGRPAPTIPTGIHDWATSRPDRYFAECRCTHRLCKWCGSFQGVLPLGDEQGGRTAWSSTRHS